MTSTTRRADAPRPHPTTRFPVPVDAALRAAGWQPGRWDIKQAEIWADALREHTSPAGHRHAVFPAAVEAWAEFGGLHITPSGPGRQIAPAALHLDPLYGLHMARTLGDLGRALDTEVCPLGAETDTQALLAIDSEGRVYALDHTGDWYLGPDIDQALATLISGVEPPRLTSGLTTARADPRYAAGITADTRKPPASVGPDTNTPPSATTRSRIPTSPLPPDGNRADDAEGTSGGGSFSTCIAISDTRCASRTYVFAPAACLWTFVNASCTTRNAVCSISAAYGLAPPPPTGPPPSPPHADCPTSTSRSARHGPSAAASSTAPGKPPRPPQPHRRQRHRLDAARPPAPSPVRSTPSISRSSVSACRPMSPTSAAFFTAFSGSFRATACSAAACTTIRLTRCATTSCISRAIRVRSSFRAHSARSSARSASS